MGACGSKNSKKMDSSEEIDESEHQPKNKVEKELKEDIPQQQTSRPPQKNYDIAPIEDDILNLAPSRKKKELLDEEVEDYSFPPRAHKGSKTFEDKAQAVKEFGKEKRPSRTIVEAKIKAFQSAEATLKEKAAEEVKKGEKGRLSIIATRLGRIQSYLEDLKHEAEVAPHDDKKDIAFDTTSGDSPGLVEGKFKEELEKEIDRIAGDWRRPVRDLPRLTKLLELEVMDHVDDRYKGNAYPRPDSVPYTQEYFSLTN